jgi:hypothetical protein
VRTFDCAQGRLRRSSKSPCLAKNARHGHATTCLLWLRFPGRASHFSGGHPNGSLRGLRLRGLHGRHGRPPPLAGVTPGGLDGRRFATRGCLARPTGVRHPSLGFRKKLFSEPHCGPRRWGRQATTRRRAEFRARKNFFRWRGGRVPGGGSAPGFLMRMTLLDSDLRPR